jgi:multidrug efflux pump subunit AcrA (membrane-fusion protein)
MAEPQIPNQNKSQGEMLTIAPGRLPSSSYLSIQTLESMPSIVSRGLIYLTLLIIVAGLIYASIARFDVTVHCPAVVQPAQVSRVFAPQSGVVRQAMISPGQTVRMGQPLMILQTTGDSNRAAGAVTISAGIDGTVLEMPFRDQGQAIKEGDMLCTLLPELVDLRVDMKILNKDAGLVLTGMPVWLSLDAFPAADFGVVQAQISEISAVASEDSQSGSVYHVSAMLPNKSIEAHGKRFQIRPGMTGIAEIVVSQRSMLSALVRGFSD